MKYLLVSIAAALGLFVALGLWGAHEVSRRTGGAPMFGSLGLPEFLIVIVPVLIGITRIAAYLLPTIIAFNNHTQNAGAICVLNLLLGWTFLGWVVALVWACTVDSAKHSESL